PQSKPVESKAARRTRRRRLRKRRPVVVNSRRATGWRRSRRLAFCKVGKGGTARSVRVRRSGARSSRLGVTARQSVLRKVLRTRQANSWGWVNFLGLKRWAYAGRAVRPTAKAWRATRSGDFVSLLIHHYRSRFQALFEVFYTAGQIHFCPLATGNQ